MTLATGWGGPGEIPGSASASSLGPDPVEYEIRTRGSCVECEDVPAETTLDDGRQVCWPCHDRLTEGSQCRS